VKPVTSLARRLSAALPAGTALVGAGLAILGLAAYGFLAIAGHALDPSGYSDLAVLWIIVFSVAPGVFFPFEQELGRLVAAQRAQGTGAGPVALRVTLVGCTVLTGLLLVTFALRRPLADSLFGGDARLVDVLAANLVALTAAHLSRGLLAGHGRFARYGAQLALDGVLRVALAVLLAVTGVRHAAGYGLVLALAPLVAVALTSHPRMLRSTPGPKARYPGVVAGLGLLIASSTFWLAVVNAGVVSARLLTTSAQAALAGALLSGLVLARVPLFAFSSVQASLLPALSAAAVAGDRDGFRRLLTRTTVAVVGLGAAGAVVCVAAGPWLVRVLFDVGTVLDRVDFAWLSTATTVYMVATVLGQAGLALGGHRDQAVAWVTGFLVLLGVTALPGEVLLRVELAFLAGSTVAGALLGAGLSRRLRRWPNRQGTAPLATPASGFVD
jgi:O-antigen/teichoic acid export membrane protein